VEHALLLLCTSARFAHTATFYYLHITKLHTTHYLASHTNKCLATRARFSRQVLYRSVISHTYVYSLWKTASSNIEEIRNKIKIKIKNGFYDEPSKINMPIKQHIGTDASIGIVAPY
jgi:hypothetical protein